MLTQRITDQRAWTAATIDSPSSWHYALPRTCLAALEQALASWRQYPQPVTAAEASAALHAAGAETLQPVRDALESGRGFAIVEGVPAEHYSPQEMQLLYWLAGQLLGQPHTQNVQGTLLYDVRDTGQDVSRGARFSVTNYESSFHTDNSFGDSVTDYVGLLCLNAARSGGLSQVVSGYAVHNELLEHHPDALAILYQPFHVDRRGGIRVGESPTFQVPVMAWDERGLLFRYFRYWIQAGHERIGQPLTAAQEQAFDVLDSVLQRPELRVEFALQPGQMFFVNNRWILHNRTAFVDHPERERRRHYVRLWLQAQKTA
jgi:hypothetical protein